MFFSTFLLKLIKYLFNSTFLLFFIENLLLIFIVLNILFSNSILILRSNLFLNRKFRRAGLGLIKFWLKCIFFISFLVKLILFRLLLEFVKQQSIVEKLMSLIWFLQLNIFIFIFRDNNWWSVKVNHLFFVFHHVADTNARVAFSFLMENVLLVYFWLEGAVFHFNPFSRYLILLLHLLVFLSFAI